MNEMRAHTVVALVTVFGCFAVMLTALIMGRTIPDSVMTLLTVSLSAVLAWYFGVRATAVGAATANTAHEAGAAEANTAGTLNAEHAAQLIQSAGYQAPPESPAHS